MITSKNNFNGASFEYENGTCKAKGEYRFKELSLRSISIEGTYSKANKTYRFWANRDESGNFNFSGVPSEVIVEVATEVKTIETEIAAINTETD